MTAEANPDTVDWAPDWVHEALPAGKFVRSKRALWADVVVLPGVPLRATTRLVALMLARFMDADGGGARPSLTTLAKHCNLGRSTVARDLGELERHGFLFRDPGNPKRSTRYMAALPVNAPAGSPPHGLGSPPNGPPSAGGGLGSPSGGPGSPRRGPEVGLEVGHEESKEAPPEGSPDGDRASPSGSEGKPPQQPTPCDECREGANAVDGNGDACRCPRCYFLPREVVAWRENGAEGVRWNADTLRDELPFLRR